MSGRKPDRHPIERIVCKKVVKALRRADCLYKLVFYKSQVGIEICIGRQVFVSSVFEATFLLGYKTEREA